MKAQIALALAAVGLVLGLIGAERAMANDAPWASVSAGTTDEGGGIGVSSGGNPQPARPSKPSPYRDCRKPVGFQDTDAIYDLLVSTNAQIPDGAGFLVCTEIATGNEVSFFTGIDQAAAAGLLAQSALATLTVELPAVETAPRTDGLLLVGLRTWFWTTNNQPTSATAAIPGLAATVTATPTTTTLTIDDNPTTTCPNGGTPYDPTQPGRNQDPTCTHIFQTNGTHTATITTTWTLTWTATNATTGTLPNLTRTTTLTLPLTAAEATTD